MKGYYRRIQPSQAKVILLDAGPRLVGAFSEHLSEKVAGYLDELGVTVHQGARVSGIDEHGVSFELDGAAAAHRHAHGRVGGRRAGGGLHRRGVRSHRRRARSRRASAGGRGPRARRPPRDLGDRGREPGRRARRSSAARARDGRDPAGASRRPRDPPRAPRRGGGVPLPRQGRARGRRTRQGDLRDPRPRAVGPPRLLHVPHACTCTTSAAAARGTA